MKFNEQRAFDVAKELKNAYEKKEKLFSLDIKTPESILPEGINSQEEHAKYLFFLGIATYKDKSERVFEKGREMYKKNPELFDPKFIRENYNADSLTDKIYSGLGHPFYRQIAENWYYSSKKLTEYDDNPLNIFNGTKDVNVGLKKLYKFNGFSTKIGNLLAAWYHKYDLVDIENIYELKIPVDSHVATISIGQEILEMEKPLRREKVAKFLQNNYLKFFREHLGFDPIEFQENMWIVGAYNCNKKVCRTLCPLEEPCKMTIDKGLFYKKAIVRPITIKPVQETPF